MSENQISPKLGYIERNPNIKFSQNIADTIWIYATYRILSFSVKLKARKMGLCGNKKGKSIGSDSPCKVVIKFEYRRNFGNSKVPICWRYRKFQS